MKRKEIINNMCMTWRHDYGLLDENEQKSLFSSMAQIFDNDIARELMTQSDVDDYEEASEVLEDKYNELLFAVESKFKDETRHETALRYIVQHERSTNSPAKYENKDML